MPRLSPLRGVRYAAPGGRLDDLVAPPYDVISEEERRALAARSPHNAVHLELPGGDGDEGRHQAAAARWSAWREEGVLVADEEPSYYLYRMGFEGEDGRPRQTTGVLGALGLPAPGDEGDVLPHERTTPKDKADRLELLRACRANLSPIWVLSLAPGLSDLCEPTGPPDARATDEAGVHHRLWRVSRAGVLDAVSSTVASAPVLIADGHHRYETALAYRDERRAANGGAPGEYDAVLAYVVELSEEQLDVRPIHRLLSGLPDGLDLAAALAEAFTVVDVPSDPAGLPEAMRERGALGLVLHDRCVLLLPRPATVAAAGSDLASEHLEVALAGLPPHFLVYQHGLAAAAGAVASGAAQAAVLLRPVSVAQIAATARGAARMPPKTTFFFPKPRTGLVFREVPG